MSKERKAKGQAASITIKEMHEDDRPREKLMLYGLDALTDIELMAILIGSGAPQESALSVAARILARISSGSAPTDFSLEDLMEVRGVGLSKASRIVAGLELGKRWSRREAIAVMQADAPSTIAAVFMDELKDEKREHFYCLLLDTKNVLLGREEISVGSLNAAIVHPREVFRPAVRRSANGVIFVHNHPSGDPTPSRQDIETTHRLVEAGKILGIDVLDHIIIGHERYVSLRQEGKLRPERR